MALTQGHRSGPLKQTNKTHKTGRHRSKGTIDNELKGKVSFKTLSKRQKKEMNKDQRRLQANQIRKNKREEVFSKKRALGGIGAAPFLVTILPLNLQIDPNSALGIMEKCDPDAIVTKTASGTTHLSIARFKQRFSFLTPPVGRGKELAVLDCLKVSDTTVLLLSANCDSDDVLDKWGKKILNMAIAQGIPTPVVVIMDLESINPKKKNQVKSEIQKIIQKALPDEKGMNLDTNSDAFNLLRRIGGQKKNVLHNKSNRPHMHVENAEFVNGESGDSGNLLLTGFLRGQALSVNQLVHIPELGDFQMSQIDMKHDPYSDASQTTVFARADANKQELLVRENAPDEMEAEQTWPTEEEIEKSKEQNKQKRTMKKVPKGMSDYQAAWIPDVVEEGQSDDESDDDDDDEESNDDFMSCNSEDDSEDDKLVDAEDEEFDTVSVSEVAPNDEKYDQEMDMEEEKATMQQIKSARADELWPDEVDTPNDIPARQRFAKYRGLESFRTSPWDVKENLPLDYARIFQFQNFDRTKRRILKEAKDTEGAMPGWFITIHVQNVSAELWAAFKRERDMNTLIVYGMLPHEQQMSVMNVLLKRAPDSTVPIKSKEKLIFQCGYRRFIVNPIFSQHTNGSKHKYERYFRENTIVVATFFAPIQFPPTPILCFRENPDTTLGLIATGSVISCNPDRVVLKRAVISGHPFKINRKSATVRYMFFNKEDVDYFSPIKLKSRCGRMGHIKESLGTHGHMKCQFDSQLKSFDTVFMYLYKRVFPKWTYEDCVVTSSTTTSQPESVVSMQE